MTYTLSLHDALPIFENNMTQGLFNSALHDLDTGSFVIGFTLQIFQSINGTNVSHTTTGNDTFLNSCTGCAQGIVNTVFLLLHFNFGSCTYVKHGNTAGQLSQTLLKFLTIVIRSSIGNLCLDLRCTGIDGVFRAAAINNGGVLLIDGDFLSGTQHLDGGVFQLQTGFFRNNGSTGQHRQVLQHLFTTIAKTGCLNSSHFQRTAQTIHHQSSQSLTVHVLSNNQEGTTALCGLLQHRKNVLHGTDLLVVNQNERIVQVGLHFLGDRKSTRLNSSHVRISYAVFCLKKKIKINDTY